MFGTLPGGQNERRIARAQIGRCQATTRKAFLTIPSSEGDEYIPRRATGQLFSPFEDVRNTLQPFPISERHAKPHPKTLWSESRYFDA